MAKPKGAVQTNKSNSENPLVIYTDSKLSFLNQINSKAKLKKLPRMASFQNKNSAGKLVKKVFF